MSFPAADLAVITFVTREASGALPRRGQSDASLPFRLHALFIGAKTGQVIAKREWPAASDRSGVVPAVAGKFLAVTPDKLLLYSSALDLLKELDLSLSRDAALDSWGVQTSHPGGRYLLVGYKLRRGGQQGAGPSEEEVERKLIDSENPQVVRVWKESGRSAGHYLSMSDDGMWLVDRKIGKIDGPVDWLCPQYEPYCAILTFINSSTVFSLTWYSKSMALFSTSRELLMKQDFLAREVFRGMVHSTDGRRFAIALDKGKGSSVVLDIGPHYSLNRIIVYDLAARQWIYTLDAKKQGIKSISGLALSPDGSQLALIDQDGVLKAYRLPEAAAASRSN